MGQILPDVIVSWPRHCDYPLWRQQIRDNRHRFNRVIIVFTNMNVNKDYREWLGEAMRDDNITFIDNKDVSADQDWRNVAVNTALKYSKSGWVWFTEQDFFWKDGFWEYVYSRSDATPYIRAVVQGRVHPCCILIKRDLLETTSKDFSVVRDISDHFSILQHELLGSPFADIPEDLWKHMGGLSQNMYMMSVGERPNYYINDLYDYAAQCLKCTVPLHNDITNLFQRLNEHI